LEMGVTLDPVAGLSLVAAWTWARHRFDEYRTAQDILDGKTIPGLPGHYVHWSAAYRSPWGLWAAFDNTHSSAYPLDDRNTVTNPGWWTSGVRAGWDGTVAGWRLQPFAGVLNLFNRRYPGSTQVNARFGRYYEPAPPRNAYLGLELSPAR